MPRAPAYDHEQLIAAAYDVLRQDGPARLALRPIAARLGVSQPALFKRIGSKRALVLEMQRWATGKTRLLIAALRGRELREGLRWLFRAYARQARSPQELVNLVAFSTHLGDMVGQVFAMLVLTVAAAEAAIGLAILVVYFRNRGTIAVEDVNVMKG